MNNNCVNYLMTIFHAKLP